MDLIEIQHLNCRFPDGKAALQDIHLRVPAGQFLVLAGPNGSGKTTLLRHLNGLIQAASGSVKVAGLLVSRNARKVRQLVGMVFQDPDTQIVGETVFDDVAFGPENLGLPQAEVRRRVMAALDTVGLAAVADRRPHTLSGGEKRRLAIAGVLAMEPRVVAFDEPFSNLDYPATRQIVAEMVKLHRQGCTLLVATHELEKVAAHAERLILLQDGRIVRDGHPRALLEEVERYGVHRPCAACMGWGHRAWPA